MATSLLLHTNHSFDPMNQLIIPRDPAGLTRADFFDRTLLHEQISMFVADLLEHDFEKLCALMYRHDVSEVLFSRALSMQTDAERASEIADLVIERELKKIETREAYRKQKPERLEE